MRRFQKDLGIKVTIVTPQNITNDFPIAAQAGKGPDILIWAHDKVGEWAGGELIAPVEDSKEFANKLFPKLGKPAVTRKGFGKSHRYGDGDIDL